MAVEDAVAQHISELDAYFVSFRTYETVNELYT